MKTYKMDQGSKAWKSIRLGKITASEVGAFAIADPKCQLSKKELQDYLDAAGIAYKKGDTNAQLEAKCPASYIAQHTGLNAGVVGSRSKLYARKIAERSGAELLSDYAERVIGYTPESLAIRRGKELEPEARAMYEDITGLSVEQVGFVEHDNGLCGASPDGFADERRIGLEIKCHGADKHAEFILDQDAFEAEHKFQVHWQLAITGCRAVDLFGYCPRMPYLLRRVWRDALTERMVLAIEELSAEYRSAIDEYNAIYREQRAALMERASA